MIPPNCPEITDENDALTDQRGHACDTDDPHTN
jgi:hypothetical protein